MFSTTGSTAFPTVEFPRIHTVLLTKMHKAWFPLPHIGFSVSLISFFRFNFYWKGSYSWVKVEVKLSCVASILKWSQHSGLAGPKSRSWSTIQVPQEPCTWATSAAFPGIVSGRWIRSGTDWTWASVHMGCRHYRWWLNLLHYNYSPLSFLPLKIFIYFAVKLFQI